MGLAINLISSRDGEWDEFKRLTVRREHELYKVKRKEGIE